MCSSDLLGTTGAEKGFYAFNNSFSNATGSTATDGLTLTNVASVNILDGTLTVAQVRTQLELGNITDASDRAVTAATVYDADLDENAFFKIVTFTKSQLSVDAGTGAPNNVVFDENNLVSISLRTTTDQAVIAGGTLAAAVGGAAGTQEIGRAHV